jgi:hypothetical protein
MTCVKLFDPRDKELNTSHTSQESSDNSTTDSENTRPADDREKALKCRENIAQAMWRDYEARLCHR